MRAGWLSTLVLLVAAPAAATTYTVANTNDSGAGSLRAAIASVNANPPGPHRIVFAIPGTGLQTIHLLSPLDPIVNPVAIDGTTQPGYNSNNTARVIELDGTASSLALVVNGAHSSLKGIAFNRFPANALNVSADGCTVQACYMGINANGTAAAANGGVGVTVNGADDVIGGRGPARRNVISGNGGTGVVFTSACLRDTLVGNYIGTDAGGTVAIPNGQHGVDTGGGGALVIDGNLISGNTLDGIHVGNISAPDPSVAVQVYRNLIGTDVTGMHKLANQKTGVRIGAWFTTVGDNFGRGNTISGNGEYGIYVDGASSQTNSVYANKIGVSSDGSLPLGNAKDGIFLDNTWTNTIGDNISSGKGNLIGGNGGYGIRIEGVAASDHIIVGNAIGTSFNGALSLGNAQAGIYTASDRALIGNTDPDIGNIIAHNHGGIYIAGVQNTMRGNAMFENGTGLGIDLLEPATGITLNDSLDNDMGANHLQNYPVLTSVTLMGDQVRLQGRLASAPNKSFDVDFYSSRQCGSLGYGEGESYLGTITVATSFAGNTTFDVTFPLTSVVGYVFTCTATDDAGSTSEFSPCGSMSTPTDAPPMKAQEYSLGESRPSPARALATLTLALPVRSSVRMQVYDAAGRVVDRLIDGELPEGFHPVQWSVAGVPAGMYFCRLEARANDGSGRHFEASRAVIVLR